jgi:hypothetical protein
MTRMPCGQKLQVTVLLQANLKLPVAIIASGMPTGDLTGIITLRLLLVAPLFYSIVMMVVEVIFYCAGTLLILENQRWMFVSSHRNSYPRNFFEAAYLSVITLTSIG